MNEFMQFWIAHDIVSLIVGGITFGVIILIGVVQYLLEKRKKKRRKKDGRFNQQTGGDSICNIWKGKDTADK